MSEIRTTKDWKEINLKDMTDEHIINCIKKIKRDGLIVKEVYCGWYAWEDWDVEIYRDEIGERDYWIEFCLKISNRDNVFSNNSAAVGKKHQILTLHIYCLFVCFLMF